jgi:hypothetical protein
MPKNPFEGIPKIPQIPTGQQRQCVELQGALVALKVVDEECSTIRGDTGIAASTPRKQAGGGESHVRAADTPVASFVRIVGSWIQSTQGILPVESR